MVILQLKKIMVNSSSSTLNNSVVVSSTCGVVTKETTCFESSNCKSPFLDSFSSASMISSNELFKERLDLKKKKQLSLNNYQASSSPTLSVQTPTTPTTPHSPSHLPHSPSRNGKQPRSRLQTTGITQIKEKVLDELPSVFDVCFASDLKLESTHSDIVERDEMKILQDALQAEYCKLKPVTFQIDRQQRADKTTVCSKSPFSITLQLPHLHRRIRN